MTVDLAHPAVSVEMLSRLLDQVSSALMAVDASGRIIVMNSEAQDILAAPASGYVGTGIDEDEGRTPQFRVMAKAFRRCLETPRALRRQTVTIGSGEGARTIGYTIAPLLHDDGGLEGAVSIFTDLTEVEARRRRSEETERFAQVGRVASWMAHEVKNPLATIQMYAQLCARTAGPDHEEPVRVIREQVTLAQSRISEMLRSLSLRSDETRKLAVTDLCAAVRDYLEREARGLPHVTFSSEVGDGPLYVPLAPADALSIVSNLVTNAAEAMEGPGAIRVLLESGVGRTVLVVEDTGAGFPDDDPQRLLRPFFTTKKRGTGLGLWVVNRIADGARGRLTLENTEEGGARVKVTLPTLGLDDLEGRTVLVADDDPALRRLLCRQLQAFGVETVEAAGGLEAADLLSAGGADLLVTDVNMPGGGGYDLLERVPERMPVLLISGAVQSEDPSAHRPGVAFLMKPFAAEEFGLALAYLLWEAAA